jgi:hypothetical protein
VAITLEKLIDNLNSAGKFSVFTSNWSKLCSECVIVFD